MIADPPEPPYVAVIFTARRTPVVTGYDETVTALNARAAQQPGYLGIESATAPDGFEITVSYWRREADAQAWKQVAEHLTAQQLGRSQWYESYEVRVTTVIRHYGHHVA